MDTLPLFMSGARADSGMRLNQFVRTSCRIRLKYGPKSTPIVSLMMSRLLWPAGFDSLPLRPVSALPLPRLSATPEGVPETGPAPFWAARGNAVAGEAFGTCDICGAPGRMGAGAVAADTSAGAWGVGATAFSVGEDFVCNVCGLALVPFGLLARKCCN